MKPTTPTRLTVETIAPLVAGTPAPAQQPLGTWFSRWHHVYSAAPATPAMADDARTPALPRRANLTTAA